MLDDLTKEIKAQLYERVKSPLFGAFVLSWVGWNYRALLGVLSGMPFKDRLAYLDALYPTGHDWLWHCVGGPLLTAVAFLLIYPWPARWMYFYWAWQQKELKKVQQRIEDETPLTQKEANTIRKASMAELAELRTELKELDGDNRELKNRLKLLQEENDKLVGESAYSKELIESVRVLQEENERLALERAQFEQAAKKAEEQITPAMAAVLANHSPTVAKDLSKVLLSTGRGAPTIDAVVAAKKDGLTKRVNGSPAAQRVFVSLVNLDGTGSLEEIAEDTGLRKLEVLDGLDLLRQRQYADELGPELYGLTSDGRAHAVSLGLPEIFRQGLPLETTTEIVQETGGAQKVAPSGRSLDVTFSGS